MSDDKKRHEEIGRSILGFTGLLLLACAALSAAAVTVKLWIWAFS